MMKHAHEYAAAQNVSAWVLLTETGQVAGRIVAVFYPSGCTASVYRYHAGGAVWNMADEDLGTVTARGTYADETIESAVRRALAGRGVFDRFSADDPWGNGARGWRVILEDHGLREVHAI